MQQQLLQPTRHATDRRRAHAAVQPGYYLPEACWTLHSLASQWQPPHTRPCQHSMAQREGGKQQEHCVQCRPSRQASKEHEAGDHYNRHGRKPKQRHPSRERLCRPDRTAAHAVSVTGAALVCIHPAHTGQQLKRYLNAAIWCRQLNQASGKPCTMSIRGLPLPLLVRTACSLQRHAG